MASRHHPETTEMDLHYCETPDGNFGDDMNLWFWDALMPDWREIHPDWTLCGIGTLINRKAFAQMDRILVCGSGTGYGPVHRFDPAHATFAWVRGPGTARILGLGGDAALADPAVMVSDFAEFARPEPRGDKGGDGDVIFVPHRLTANLDLDWDRLGQRAGVRVVSPKGDAKSVIRELRDARLVVAESMHAAIIADALRTPWVPLAVSHHFNTFKWQDWADSLEIDLEVNTALRLPREAFFALRNARKRLRRGGGGGGDKAAAQGGGGGTVQPFENPNYMGEGERDRVKGLIRRFGGVFEALLARDIARVARLAPSMSDARVLEARKAGIRDRVARIRSGEIALPERAASAS
jgi:succinoglycan biosynthesis protein ExoV